MPTVDTARYERCPYGRGYLSRISSASASSLISLSRCHEQTDVSYVRGGLMVTALGGGRFSST